MKAFKSGSENFFIKSTIKSVQDLIPTLLHDCPYAGTIAANATLSMKNYFPFLSTGCYRFVGNSYAKPNSKPLLGPIFEFEIQSSIRFL